MCNIRVTVVLTLAIILVILRILGQKGCPYDSPHRLRGDDGGITQLLIFLGDSLSLLTGGLQY
jgi:hypothetical protein